MTNNRPRVRLAKATFRKIAPIILGTLWTASSLASEVTLRRSIALISGGGRCSGALIAPDLVLTAAHCVSKVRPAKVNFQDLQESVGVEWVKFTSHSDSDHGLNDLGLVKLSRPVDLPVLKILDAEEKIAIGNEVSTFGHRVSGEKYKYSKGTVTAIGNGWLQIAIDAGFGNSGGPIIDANENIVGVASRIRLEDAVPGGHATLAALDHVAVRKFLAEANVSPAATIWDAWSTVSLETGYSIDKSTTGKLAHSLDLGVATWILDRVYGKLGVRMGNHVPFTYASLGYKFAALGLAVNPHVLFVAGEDGKWESILGVRQELNICFVDFTASAKGYGLTFGIGLPLAW